MTFVGASVHQIAKNAAVPRHLEHPLHCVLRNPALLSGVVGAQWFDEKKGPTL